MFDIGDTYWFVLKGDIKERYTVKGKIIEENQFMVKILRDNGEEKLISFSNILDSNKERSSK